MIILSCKLHKGHFTELVLTNLETTVVGPLSFAHIAANSIIDMGYLKVTRSVVSPFSYSDWHQMGLIIKF